MILLFEHEHQKRMGEWLSVRTGNKYENAVYLGVANNDKIIAVCGYQFNNNTAYGHIAIDGYFPKLLLGLMFDYPFNQAGVNRIIAGIEENNIKPCGFVEKLGFKRIQDDGSIKQYEMLKNECKWVKE